MAGPARKMTDSPDVAQIEPMPLVARRSEKPAGGDLVAASAAPQVAPRSRKRPIIFTILALALATAGYFGFHWWTVGRFLVSTDDAYVGADTSILAAKVGGHVMALEVDTNEPVKAGQVIARIDDGDYRLALEAAQAKVATQEATIARFGQQVQAAQALVNQAKAQRVASAAELNRAQRDYERQVELVKTQVASQAVLDTALANRDKAQAALDAADAAIVSAEANVSVLEAQRTEAQRTLDEVRTSRDQAQRNLDFTLIKAPFDGVIGNRAVQVGQLVQPGSRLVALVPLGHVYVDANFKETQLARLHAGQKVNLEVDAFPDETFHGRVLSVAPASGSVFSLLPPENATGNFTKIVQRLPLRIELDPEVLARGILRPGMSVIATVDTRDGA